ncbi:MAG: hypothetical protein KDC57_06885 [Saprospiraceae bacterium]|nr:hypothetical protein [Saprospiraceae bacterium]
MRLQVSICLLIIQLPLFGQAYFTAGGVRLGTENGLSVKQRILKHSTIELGILSGFKTDYLSVGVDYHRHYPIFIRNLNLYAGLGLVSQRFQPQAFEQDVFKRHGVTFTGGIEATLGRVNVAWDYKPMFFLGNSDRLFASNSGISIRYVFLRNKDVKKWEREQDKKHRKKNQRKRPKLFHRDG